VCTSPNEVICHGIPDQRVLKDGDILNIDVTLYHGGFHGDLNETYYIGEKALADPDAIRIVETSRECLDKAIAMVKPGTLFREYGNVIEKHAKAEKCSVIKTYCGHGINQLFHCAPNVPHYAKNKAIGEAKPGMCFTIEPMISLGTHRDKTWPDDWTSVTADGTRTAQFGRFFPHCAFANRADLHPRTYITGHRRWSRDSNCKAARLSWWPSRANPRGKR
jgi:methionyl aminopeptidase